MHYHFILYAQFVNNDLLLFNYIVSYYYAFYISWETWIKYVYKILEVFYGKQKNKKIHQS